MRETAKRLRELTCLSPRVLRQSLRLSSLVEWPGGRLDLPVLASPQSCLSVAPGGQVELGGQLLLASAWPDTAEKGGDHADGVGVRGACGAVPGASVAVGAGGRLVTDGWVL